MSSLAEKLQAVKLKKSSEPCKDYSSPKTAGFMSKDEVDLYQSNVLDVNTEEWLEHLRDHTFPSSYVPMSCKEAQLFVNIYERLYSAIEPSAISRIDWKESLSQEESLMIAEISHKLQNTIDTFLKDGKKFVFVKLSSRSPKDAPMAQRRFKELYKHYLNERAEDRCQENYQISCLLKAAFEALKMSTAQEVLDACLRSERVYQDMLLALAVPDRFRENWIVRQFVEIDIDMEFRGFVHNNSLTALSQYNYLIFSERLAKNKDFYFQAIQGYFSKEIQPRLEKFIPSYVIDFAVCNEGAKIWVIEINPFLTTTDAALFSWEHEKPLLEGSGDNTVFRITEKPRPGAKSMLPTGMKDLINECASELSD